MCSCSGSCNCNSTTIPKGPQGPQGAIGPQGIQGPAGDSAVILLGSVSTGIAGSDVIITNSSIIPNEAEFNFTIPRGDKGETGDDGYVSVERIKANSSDAANPGASAITTNFTELDADGKIVTFTLSFSTEDSSGIFGSAGFSVTYGLTTTTLFYVTSSGPNYGILPAKIKFDKNPTIGTSGYESNEFINFVTADIKITRITSSSALIEGTIYGYNAEIQQQFGLARFPQKIWYLRAGFSSPDNFTIDASVTDDGSGTSVGMINILRYNTTL